MRLARAVLIAAIVLSFMVVDTPAIASPHAHDQLTSEQMIADALLREYKLFVPASYDRPGSIHSLALVFHGLYSDDSSLIPFVAPVASARGLVVAFPQGLGKSWNAGTCCGFARAAKIDDVGFAAQLIASLSRRFHPRSVVTAGYSNGAMLSWLIGCRRAGVVNGVVDASGTQGVAEPSCHPGRPIMVTAVHGRMDQTVPYEGGSPNTATQATLYADPFRPISSVITEWGRDHNHCAQAARFMFPDWSTQRWAACAGGVVATLITIDRMGHEVPDHRTGAPVDFGSLIAETAADAT